jgi:saccharopine dehydrogenase-like NADP-dependent oxidoreductase
MSRETLLKKGICPRCGQPFRWIYSETIYGRAYLYAVHEYVDENGRKKRRKCYLGPADSYEYVSKTHDLEFYGMTKDDRYIRYLEEIIDLFDVDKPVSIDPEDFKKNYENIMRMRSLVKRINNEVEERLEKIIQTMISDVKASIDVLKRDYANDPKALELVKELETLDEEIKKKKLIEKYRYKEDTLKKLVSKYLYLKNKLKIFNI